MKLRAIAAAVFLCAASPAFAQINFNGVYETYPYERMLRKKARLSVSVVGSRPAGCPRRYCGCASARYVGLSGARWNVNLAANWARYLPRSSPAPMMAAARPGHVFILLSHEGGSAWKVYDPNSGGGKTRIHVRSISGYVIVNPRGTPNYASARKRARR